MSHNSFWDFETHIEASADDLTTILIESTPARDPADLPMLTPFQRGVLIGIKGVIFALWRISNSITNAADRP